MSRPFSNGTEGEAWMAVWCDTCTKDAPARDGRYEEGCPLIVTAMVGETPEQWTEDRMFTLGHQYTCADYEQEVPA